MPQVFEALMLVTFGISWPASIIKSYKSRTNKGKSILFLSLIAFAYACGIVSKLVMGNVTYVFIFYVIDFLLVFTDICLYIRNSRIDRASRAAKEQAYLEQRATDTRGVDTDARS